MPYDKTASLRRSCFFVQQVMAVAYGISHEACMVQGLETQMNDNIEMSKDRDDLDSDFTINLPEGRTVYFTLPTGSVSIYRYDGVVDVCIFQDGEDEPVQHMSVRESDLEAAAEVEG